METNDGVSETYLGDVVARFSSVLMRPVHFARILGRKRGDAELERDRESGHGDQHGGSDSGSWRGNDDDRNGPTKKIEWTSAEWFGGIALVGLLLYALIRGMDATVSGMLMGLFGALIYRVASDRRP